MVNNLAETNYYQNKCRPTITLTVENAFEDIDHYKKIQNVYSKQWFTNCQGLWSNGLKIVFNLHQNLKLIKYLALYNVEMTQNKKQAQP